MTKDEVKQNGIILISTFSDEQSLIDLSNILVNGKKTLCLCKLHSGKIYLYVAFCFTA